MADQTNTDETIIALLKQLPPSHFAALLTHRLPQPRVCAGCGKDIPVGDSGINVITSVTHVIGSPGHPGIPPWQCPQEEHWACSPDCWAKVAHQCIDEHMVPIVKEIHKRLTTVPPSRKVRAVKTG